MLSDNTIELVQGSFAKVEPIAMTAADIFYDKLFELDPELKPLFKGDMAEQKKKLMQMIGTAVKMLTKLDELVPVVEKLGARHQDYGVKEAHYATVATALLDTLAEGLGEEFTDEVKQAWIEVYTVLQTVMLSACDEAA